LTGYLSVKFFQFFADSGFTQPCGMHRMVLRTGQLLLSYDCCVCTPSTTNLVWESDQKATTLTCRVDKKKSHTFHPSSGGNSKAIRVNRYCNYEVAILFKFQPKFDVENKKVKITLGMKIVFEIVFVILQYKVLIINDQKSHF
jgi:hypothetical protein